jgi:hypothetical protein
MPLIVLLTAACATGTPTAGAEASAEDSLMPSAPTGARLCEIDDRPLSDLVHGTLGEPEPGGVMGQATCEWNSDMAETVRVMSATVPDWMASAPNVDTPSDYLAGLRESGEFEDPDDLARIDRAQELLDSDGGPTAGEFCEIHALLIGLPPAEHPTVTIRIDKVRGTRTLHQEHSTARDLHIGSTCAHGRSFSLSVSSDHLDGSEAEAAALLDAVVQVAQDSK